MQTLPQILYALSLFLTGLYAGMTLFCQLGLLPAMAKIAPQDFLRTWRPIDAIMDRAMPPYKLTLLLITLATSICFYTQHQQTRATITAASFLLSLIALVLTIAKQLPINKQIQTIPDTAPDSAIRALLQQATANFAVRLVLALLAFALLCYASIA